MRGGDDIKGDVTKKFKRLFLSNVAIRSGLDQFLYEYEINPPNIAKTMNLTYKDTIYLLDAFSSCDLIKRKGDGYLCNEMSDFKNSTINTVYLTRRWEILNNGTTALKQGIADEESICYEKITSYLNEMNYSALATARHIITKFTFDNHSFLDIGAGYGTYSIAVANAFFTSKGIAFDLPFVKPLIDEHITQAGIYNLTTKGGNYKKDEFGDEFDDVFLFSIIHQEQYDDIHKLLCKVYRTLKSNGRLFISSFFLNDDRQSPDFSVLFAVEMMLLNESGKVYTHTEMTDLIKNAGFRYWSVDNSIPGPATLYLAIK